MVAEQLEEIKRRMAAAAIRAERDPQEIVLVAVSKGHTVDSIREAYDTGHRDFGENRAQELAEKAPLLPNDIRWHFIGSLQTRQAKLARPYTYLLHSLDRVRLVNAWSSDGPCPPALLQVNVAAEEQKHGAGIGGVRDLLASARQAGIDCRGLMMIPPLANTAEDSRQWFAQLRNLRDELGASNEGLTDLSMGMTDDFEVAIQEGSTTIRVGRAIFGAPGAPA